MSSTKVVTGKIRGSFCHILEPYAQNEGDDPKYSMQILVPKSDKATISKIESAMEAAKDEAVKKGKFKANAKIDTVWRDGDEEFDTFDTPRPELQGHMFFSARSKDKPGFIDSKGREITDPALAGSGNYFRVSVSFFGYSFNGKRGISAALNNVLFIEEGESLGGTRASASSDFSDFLEEGSAASDFTGDDDLI